MSIIEKTLSAAQYWGTMVMIRLVLALPYRVAIALGRLVGLLLYAALPLRRKIVTVQMRTALGMEDIRSLVVKVFMNQGEILVDTVRYAYLNDEEIKGRITVESREHLDEALASGRGLMMITGHIGNWEILSHLPRLMGIQFCVMADVRKDARLESIIDGIRSRSGATILPPKGKALMLIKELRKGHTIGVIIDQRGRRRDGLFCDAFGLPAPTNPAPAFIAVKGEAMVLPVYAIREDRGFRIRFDKPVDARSFGQGEAAIQDLSDFMQAWVTSVVRRYPDQWFWLHSRWIKRSTMRKILKRGLDFREFVLSHAQNKGEDEL
jgi:KDO2-lipid IV(A) lauroyltransferase